jgi:CubicO group peptidase (beta-lactamase class C family)
MIDFANIIRCIHALEVQDCPELSGPSMMAKSMLVFSYILTAKYITRICMKLYKKEVFIFQIFLLFLLCPIIVYAQINQNVKETQIDNIFKKWDTPHTPGCAVGVYQDGKILFENGYGMANLKKNTPITPGTKFAMASISKEFTAAAVVLLSLRGKMNLHKPVRDYIPEMPEYPGDYQPTVGELLHHTSGIPDLFALLSLYDISLNKAISSKKIIRVITGQSHLNFEPGSKFLYSNSGYSLLAEIVKRVSGQSLKEFTSKNIFMPLGMGDTIFRDNRKQKIKHQAMSYRRGDGNKFRLAYRKDWEGIGATGLRTNIVDFAKWNQQLIQNRLPDAEGFDKRMLRPGVLNNGDTLNYAMGLMIRNYKGQKTVSHDGIFMGFKTSYFSVPKQHYGSAIFCNSGNINPIKLNREVAALYLKVPFNKWLKKFGGIYYSKELNLKYALKVHDGNLYLEKKQGAPEKKLTYARESHGVVSNKTGRKFRTGDWNILFKESDQGQVEGFTISRSRAYNIFFKKEE